ncbi:MAG: PIN domain-containing protein [Spirochaetes bacterium]|nr:PIN domain-containing protein [Spirochaetota bacterium]
MEPIPCVQLHRDHGRPTLVIRPYRERRPPGEIFSAARRAVDGASMRMALSVSLWEIALKSSRGRLELPLELDEYVARLERVEGLEIIPLDGQTAVRGERLDWDHRDPVDRWIVAHAHRLNVPLVTSDATMQAFTGLAVW